MLEKTRFPWSLGGAEPIPLSPWMSFSTCAGASKAAVRLSPSSLLSTLPQNPATGTIKLSLLVMPRCLRSKQGTFTMLSAFIQSLSGFVFWIIEQQSEVNEKGISKHSCCQTSFNVCFPQGQTCILMLHNAAINGLIIWQNKWFFAYSKIAFPCINPTLMMRHVHQVLLNLKPQPH